MPWDAVKGIQKLHRPDGCAQTRQGVDINACTQVLKTPETKMDKTKTKLERYGVSVFGKERYSALKKITRDNPSQPLTLRPHLCPSLKLTITHSLRALSTCSCCACLQDSEKGPESTGHPR